MAREARAQRWVVAHAALAARQNAALGPKTRQENEQPKNAATMFNDPPSRQMSMAAT